MSLNSLQPISSDSGDRPAIIKYNASAGRWYADEIEIQQPKMAIDMENGKTGWVFFQKKGEGGPITVWDDGQQQPRPQGGNYKYGFKVMMYVANKFPTGQVIGVREWMSNALNAVNAVVVMNAQYNEGRAANPGKLPIFTCVSVNQVHGAGGSINYEPVMQLTGWVDRSRLPGMEAPMVTAPPVITNPADGSGFPATQPTLAGGVAAPVQPMPPQQGDGFPGDPPPQQHTEANPPPVGMPAQTSDLDDEIPF